VTIARDSRIGRGYIAREGDTGSVVWATGRNALAVSKGAARVSVSGRPGQLVFSDFAGVYTPGIAFRTVSWYFNESSFPLASNNPSVGGDFTLVSNMLAGMPGYIGNGATRGPSGGTTCLMTAPLTMSAANTWTIAYWSRQSGVASSNAAAVYLANSGGSQVLTVAVGTLLDSNRAYWVSQLSGPASSVSETLDTAWVHAAFVYDGSTQTVKVYKNGALIATLTGFINASYTAVLVRVGSGFISPATTIAWDSLMIANLALNDTQILAVYQEGL